MSEIAYEWTELALEAGGVAQASKRMTLVGGITPIINHAAPNQQRGVLAANSRSHITRKSSAWSLGGALDLGEFIQLLPMLSQSVQVTDVGAAQILIAKRVMSGSAAIPLTAQIKYGGLLNSADGVLSASSAYINSLSITNDANSTDVAQVQVSGIAHPSEKETVANPAEIIDGTFLSPLDMQMWLTPYPGAYDGVEIQGRLIRVQHQFNTGIVAKHMPSGPATPRTFNRLGIQKVVGCVTTVTLALDDFAQYDIFESGEPVRCRVRHNGDQIGDTNAYEFLEVSVFGVLENLQWGEQEGANRTVTFTINSSYDEITNSDWQINVQTAASDGGGN